MKKRKLTTHHEEESHSTKSSKRGGHNARSNEKAARIGGVEKISGSNERVATMDPRLEGWEDRLSKLEFGFDTLSEDLKRYVGVSFEEFDSRIQPVIEMLASLAEFRAEVRELLMAHEDFHASVNFRLNALE